MNESDIEVAGGVTYPRFNITTNPTLPLNRVKEAFRLAPGEPPGIWDTPATFTHSANNDASAGSTQISGGVDKLWQNGLGSDYTLFGTWTDYFTVSSGAIHYYIAPSSGVDSVAIGIIAFRLDDRYFEILGRAGNNYTIMADGVRIAPLETAGTADGGADTKRTMVDLGSRKIRDIVIYGRFLGFAGIAISATGAISPIDTRNFLRSGLISDSYGAGLGPTIFGGPYGEAIIRLLRPGYYPLFHTSPGGGSGYITGGTSSKTFGQRLSNLLLTNPEFAIVAGGINDGSGLTSAALSLFQGIRAALPNAVICSISSQTPLTSQLTSARTKHDEIYAALQQISPPWIDIDMTRGSWSNSSGASGRNGNSPWVFGTGKVGATTGVGNSDLYTSSDSVHPEYPAGGIYLGQNIFYAMRDAVLSL